MTLEIGILLGDDIGPEVVPEAVKVMQAAAARACADIEWHSLPPVRSYPTLPSLHKDVDIVFLRETTEDLMRSGTLVAGSGELKPNDDTAIGMRVITRQGANRVAREAFEIARTRPRRKVTAVHKAPSFKLCCGLFSEECGKVATEYPQVVFEEVLIDSFAMKLVMKPQQYDVVVTTNLFGDIFTDQGAGLGGGLGLAPGLVVGTRQAMAQATHGGSGAVSALLQQRVRCSRARAGPGDSKKAHANRRAMEEGGGMTKGTISMAALLLATTALVASAQQKPESPGAYPAKPVRLLVGNAPGGGIDLTARAIAQKLTERWGRSFVVDNRPGGTGLIAIDLTANANPDGYIPCWSLQAASSAVRPCGRSCRSIPARQWRPLPSSRRCPTC